MCMTEIMMKSDERKDRVRVNISVTEEFWRDWKDFAKSQNMNASQLIEFSGRAMINSSKGIFKILDQIYDMGKKDGKAKRK